MVFQIVIFSYSKNCATSCHQHCHSIMKKYLPLLVLFPFLSFSQSVSFEKWISLKSVGTPLISPDGAHTLFAVTSTDWKENGYDTEYWLSKNGQTPFQLTRTIKGSSNNARWSPDSKWISFVADRGDKSQLQVLSIDGGEAMQITKEEDGIGGGYEWWPDSKSLVIYKTEPESKKDKTIKERYGAYGIEGTEYRRSHLWSIPFNADSVRLMGLYPCYTSKDSTKTSDPCITYAKPIRLTQGDSTVTGFDISSDGKYMVYTMQPDPMINSGIHADIYLYEVSTKKSTKIISNPGGDFAIQWSPDSKQFLYGSTLNDTISHFYKNNRVFIYDLSSNSSKEILKSFDENKGITAWTHQGIYFNASIRTSSKLYKYHPTNDTYTEILIPADQIGNATFSKDGSMMNYSARSNTTLMEIYTSSTNTIQPRKITSFSDQINTWNTPINEVIKWKSKDGAEIEGVLIKPRDFDPGKKYPLLCVIHGGPTGVDRPDPVAGSVYPIMHWAEKGAVILRVNYRGSAGYGEKFRALNVRNLGVGDMWDVMTGVDNLISKGFIDSTRMGCMGWSQGGYISAFLTTNTKRFKAISVGAGISNWMTYYVNTDITPFTRQYLLSTPWSDAAVYARTSPMTTINNASTPTLIQHGEFDRRVPIPNAYELYRGLQDRNIPSRLIVYKGFGHGINKPKERLAAVWHNWQWFGKYIWGEEVEIPTE